MAGSLKSEGFRIELDLRNEKIGYKIREARLEKVPYMLVVGDREADTRSVSVRHREDGDRGLLPLDEFISGVKMEMLPPEIDYKED